MCRRGEERRSPVHRRRHRSLRHEFELQRKDVTTMAAGQLARAKCTTKSNAIIGAMRTRPPAAVVPTKL